jgi:hypothetical protein
MAFKQIGVTLNGSEFADVLPAHDLGGLAGPSCDAQD